MSWHISEFSSYQFPDQFTGTMVYERRCRLTSTLSVKFSRLKCVKLLTLEVSGVISTMCAFRMFYRYRHGSLQLVRDGEKALYITVR